MENRENLVLEKHIAYRFIKVLYIFSIVVIILLGLLFASDSFPRKVVDYASIDCYGKDIFFTSESVGINLYSEYIDSWDDKKIRAICESDDIRRMPVRNRITGETVFVSAKVFDPISYEFLGFLPDNVNYTPEFIYKNVGSWFEYLKIFGLTVLVGVIILTIIKSAILYILFGKQQWLNKKKKEKP